MGIKKGVTTATFENVPDAPFTNFETIFPTGPHSALTANVAESKHYDLCGEKQLRARATGDYDAAFRARGRRRSSIASTRRWLRPGIAST
jgi:hypothetical protein